MRFIIFVSPEDTRVSLLKRGVEGYLHVDLTVLHAGKAPRHVTRHAAYGAHNLYNELHSFYYN